MTNTLKTRQEEQGNALFLILIAVVLFAALSYAITQSNRSSGNAGRETNTISGTTITQYTSGIRTGITRMLLRGISPADVLFHKPSDAAYSTAANTVKEVFHPDGGGVGYQTTDPNVVNTLTTEVATYGTDGYHQNWYFRSAKPVRNIATTAGEVVAILADVRKGICEQLNQQIRGTTAIPLATANDAAFIDATTEIVGSAAAPNGIDGQPFGCVQATASGKYYFYHVLAEQ